MKVLPWFALLFAYTAVPADAHLALTGTPEFRHSGQTMVSREGIISE